MAHWGSSFRRLPNYDETKYSSCLAYHLRRSYFGHALWTCIQQEWCFSHHCKLGSAPTGLEWCISVWPILGFIDMPYPEKKMATVNVDWSGFVKGLFLYTYIPTLVHTHTHTDSRTHAHKHAHTRVHVCVCACGAHWFQHAEILVLSCYVVLNSLFPMPTSALRGNKGINTICTSLESVLGCMTCSGEVQKSAVPMQPVRLHRQPGLSRLFISGSQSPRYVLESFTACGEHDFWRCWLWRSKGWSVNTRNISSINQICTIPFDCMISYSHQTVM